MGRWQQLHDDVLAEDVRELLGNDRRLAELDGAIQVEVRGGVAHLSGRAASARQRGLLRDLVGRTRGIYAVWETVSIPGEPRLRILDIGCGDTKQDRCATGIDRLRGWAVDVLADLETGLPFANESIDRVYAVHVLEHIGNLLGLIDEIHRVLKPDGVLHVMVPHWQHVDAVADPTHIRFFSPETFRSFCLGRGGHATYRPLAISANADTIFADLAPIKSGDSRASERLLARFFD